MGFVATYSIVLLVFVVLTVVGNWKVFEKAGKPGWAAIVPIYNTVVLYQVSGLNPWLLLLYLVPFVNYIAMFVLSIMLAGKLAKAFGKGTGFAVGIFFLQPVFTLILGFGDAKYEGPVA
ncbi:MAG: signal peptidase I [Bacilli bacterium]|nr:signal peptidase I [Bacilli bacterium]